MYLLIKLKEWLYSINIKNSVHHIHEINHELTSQPSTDFSSFNPEISELKNSSCAGLLSLPSNNALNAIV